MSLTSADCSVNAIGAYFEDRVYPAFTHSPTDRGTGYMSNSVSDCFQACPDYHYIGLYSYGDRCWCDNDLDTITRYGPHVGNCDLLGTENCNYIYEIQCGADHV